jgi:hypothetical protein
VSGSHGLLVGRIPASHIVAPPPRCNKSFFVQGSSINQSNGCSEIRSGTDVPFGPVLFIAVPYDLSDSVPCRSPCFPQNMFLFPRKYFSFLLLFFVCQDYYQFQEGGEPLTGTPASGSALRSTVFWGRQRVEDTL